MTNFNHATLTNIRKQRTFDDDDTSSSDSPSSLPCSDSREGSCTIYTSI